MKMKCNVMVFRAYVIHTEIAELEACIIREFHGSRGIPMGMGIAKL